MQYFESNHGKLVWRNEGETLMIMPWGENSLRVLSGMMREPELTDFALLSPADEAQAIIKIEERNATICNGKITAEITMDSWRSYARIR